MRYKVGDKVRIVKQWPADRSARENSKGGMDKWLGKTMTIREVCDNGYRMEEDREEHLGRGWYWWPSAIAGLAHTEKIVITTDGTTTLARLYDGKTVIKRAEAKCSPDDAFDFEKGAKIAMERLLSKEKPVAPTFAVGDIVRIKGHTSYGHNFPVGTICRVYDMTYDDLALRSDGYSQIVHSRDVEKIEF